MSVRPRVLFRWTVWDTGPDAVHMLGHSVGTFRAFFGGSAEYVVFSDDAAALAPRLHGLARVLDLAGRFGDERSTWRKWAPAARWRPDAVEIRVDADMFLLEEPAELVDFCFGVGPERFLAATEWLSAPWLYGAFARLVGAHHQVNAGLVGQRPGADLSEPLELAYRAWRASVAAGREVQYHDEQGAVAYVLDPLIAAGDVVLLPADRYRIVCPLNDPPVTSVSGLTLLHAAYPDHPAFHRFLPEIGRVSGLPVEPAPAPT